MLTSGRFQYGEEKKKKHGRHHGSVRFVSNKLVSWRAWSWVCDVLTTMLITLIQMLHKPTMANVSLLVWQRDDVSGNLGWGKLPSRIYSQREDWKLRLASFSRAQLRPRGVCSAGWNAVHNNCRRRTDVCCPAELPPSQTPPGKQTESAELKTLTKAADMQQRERTHITLSLGMGEFCI